MSKKRRTEAALHPFTSRNGTATLVAYESQEPPRRSPAQGAASDEAFGPTQMPSGAPGATPAEQQVAHTQTSAQDTRERAPSAGRRTGTGPRKGIGRSARPSAAPTPGSEQTSPARSTPATKRTRPSTEETSTRSHASDVGTPKPKCTTTTTASRSKSDGSATGTTSNTTLPRAISAPLKITRKRLDELHQDTRNANFHPEQN